MVKDGSGGGSGVGFMPTLPAPPTGALVAGKYRLIDELDRSPTAAVYSALQTSLGRKVALKLMSPDADEEARRLLHGQARISSQLAHPNVVDVIDLGEHEGAPFIAMELLEMETLRERLDAEPRLPIPLLAHVGADILRALRAAHAHGVVHRGLSASEVFVSTRRDGTPMAKLTNFGDRADNDPLHDLFAAGVVLYEALTGNLPFDPPDFRAPTPPEGLNPSYSELPPGPSEARSELGLDADAFVIRALAEQRTGRFQSADEMLDAWTSLAVFEDYIHE